MEDIYQIKEHIPFNNIKEHMIQTLLPFLSLPQLLVVCDDLSLCNIPLHISIRQIILNIKFEYKIGGVRL